MNEILPTQISSRSILTRFIGSTAQTRVIGMRTTRAGARRGVALVIVLGFLVLMTVFAVAFFTSVTTNSKSSYQYAKNVQTQQLAQSVVSVAMSQIKDATTQGPNITWISQPGMIRTFDSAGAPVESYRLYSAATMKKQGTIDPVAEASAEQRKDWASSPAHMVDLNRPARDALKNLVYPILDPRANDSVTPAESIQGYEFDPSNMGGSFVNPASPAPMPVSWLYVLAKGDVVTGQGTNPTSVTINAASKDNPVVGRIAFWTDDESCKVNINTAAGDEWNPEDASYGKPAGSYWDEPRTYSLFDREALAKFQPAQGEYQRYPGHPATTYLSAVFPTLTRSQIGSITSRVQKGGSLGGTEVADQRVLADADRLYASIEELIFDTDRKDQPITKTRLERARFFLTAHSRAPESNLFNMPRVAIWPIHKNDSTAYRTAFDRLTAFCSTVGPKAKGNTYFFERGNADSVLSDFSGRNVALYSYLQKLTDRKIPGYGGKFTDKYGVPDRDQILTEILDYVRSANLYDDNLTANQFTDARSGTSTTSVNAGHGQVAPLHVTAPDTATVTMGFGRFYTVSEAALHFICTADPLVDKDSNMATGDAANKTLNGAAIPPGKRRIEALLLLELFSPAQGWTGLAPDMQFRIKGLNTLAINGTPLGMPADGTAVLKTNGTGTYHGRAWGGSSGFRFVLRDARLPARQGMPNDSGFSATTSYPFVSVPITISATQGDSSTMSFTGGDVNLEIYANSNPKNQTADSLVQTITLKFPSQTFPVPSLVTTGTDVYKTGTPPVPYVDSKGNLVGPPTTKEDWWTFSYSGAIKGHNGRLYSVSRPPGDYTTLFGGSFVRDEDVVRSILPNHGDYRLIAGRSVVPDSVFQPHPYYDTVSKKLAHSLVEPVGFGFVKGADDRGDLVPNANYGSRQRPDILEWNELKDRDPMSLTRLQRGDWDTGMTTVMDGAYINKPDEGNNYRGTGSQIPYFDNNQTQEAGGETFFSPNRQIPSPVMFGSLPTGMLADSGVGRSWQTLLFRPDTTAATAGEHAGAVSPKDHLLLDLFWMPVVEPYAISEPFSTGGKINLNCQIAPFTYIKRTTALRALLKSERVTAIPLADANKYKGGSAGVYRLEINADETLKGFEQRFSTNQPFRSASEICEMYLVPEGQTLAGMPTFWNNARLTGDNLRERPYATLYPRLTTKSNTYSVHYYVQTLQQVNRNLNGNWNTWDEAKDKITGEYRGTTLIERYIDLDDSLPDFATLDASSTETLDQHTKLRVISNKRFAP